MERGDVRRDQGSRDRGGGQEGDVLFHLLHHPGGVWQLYPSLITDTLSGREVLVIQLQMLQISLYGISKTKMISI